MTYVVDQKEMESERPEHFHITTKVTGRDRRSKLRFQVKLRALELISQFCIPAWVPPVP